MLPTISEDETEEVEVKHQGDDDDEDSEEEGDDDDEGDDEGDDSEEDDNDDEDEDTLEEGLCGKEGRKEDDKGLGAKHGKKGMGAKEGKKEGNKEEKLDQMTVDISKYEQLPVSRTPPGSYAGMTVYGPVQEVAAGVWDCKGFVRKDGGQAFTGQYGFFKRSKPPRAPSDGALLIVRVLQCAPATHAANFLGRGNISVLCYDQQGAA